MTQKFASKFEKIELSAMLTASGEMPIVLRPIKDLMWGYDDTLIKLAADILPPEQIPPFDKFGYFIGVN